MKEDFTTDEKRVIMDDIAKKVLASISNLNSALHATHLLTGKDICKVGIDGIVECLSSILESYRISYADLGESEDFKKLLKAGIAKARKRHSEPSEKDMRAAMKNIMDEMNKRRG